MLLTKISRYIKDKKAEGANIKVLKSQDENEDFSFKSMPEPSKTKKAMLIEGSKFTTKEVKIRTEVSEFSYFLDGIEKKQHYSLIILFRLYTVMFQREY